MVKSKYQYEPVLILPCETHTYILVVRARSGTRSWSRVITPQRRVSRRTTTSWAVASRTGTASFSVFAASPIATAVIFLHSDVSYLSLDIKSNNQSISSNKEVDRSACNCTKTFQYLFTGRLNARIQRYISAIRTNSGRSYLVRSKSRIVQLLYGVLHIIVSQKFDDAGTVLVNVCEAYVAGLAHVILEVLPAAGGWQTANQDSVLRSSRGGPATARIAHLAATTPAAVPSSASTTEIIAGATAAWKLDS